MRSYVALLHEDPDSGFGVSFPDFPGCVSAGFTLGEAAAMGAEALGGHIDLMIDEGLAIPEPSVLDDIMADPENRDGVLVLVPVASKRPVRAMRANITVPEDVLARIDAYAERQVMSRSGFLAYAALKQIEGG